MKTFLALFTLKRILIASVGVLFLLAVFSFYGPYTNKFYFLKPDNYIFPILALVHLVFLYVLWFKTKEEELTDPQMRNLEYSLYVISIAYIYKTGASVYVLSTYYDYEYHLLPGAFLPLGILIMALHFLLLALTLLTFKYRKDKIGNYRFDEMNHIDSWE